MHRDSSSIFESYKIVKEQTAPISPATQALLTAIQNTSMLTPAMKETFLKVAQSPQFIADMDRANQQTGQAPYGAEYSQIKAQQNQQAQQDLDAANATSTKGPQNVDSEGNPIDMNAP
jgi:hypothetical protein